MTAPVSGGRALRFSSRTTRRLWLSILIWIVLTPLLSWLALTGTRLGTVKGVTIIACVLAVLVFGPQLYVYLRVRGLRLAGEHLIRGGRSCDLTTSWDVTLEVTRGRSERLVLQADELRVVLGSSAIPSYFEPDDVRRIAALLARSTHPGPREVGEQLTHLADEPRRGSWPLPRKP